MTSSYSLGEHFEDFIQRLVKDGRYASASEVIRDGLRLVEEREELRAAKLAALRNLIAEGSQWAGWEFDLDAFKAKARTRRTSRA